MSVSTTSHSATLHEACEHDRHKDVMYRILTVRTCPIRDKLAHGIGKLIAGHSKHPAVMYVIEQLDAEHAILVQRALIIVALVYEPDFLQYALELPNTSGSAISEYAVVILPALIDEVLNGNIALDDFVLQAIHAYTVL